MSFLRKLGLRNWFKKTKQNSTRTHLNKPLSIESLENRITPVTRPLIPNPGQNQINLRDGNGQGQVLHITTSDLVDTLTIGLNGTVLTINNSTTFFDPVSKTVVPVTFTGGGFGQTVDAKTNTYTLDFSDNSAGNFGGILVEMLGADGDTLNVIGMDLSTISKFINPGNNCQVEFYGDRISNVNNHSDVDTGNNNLNLSGTISSISDDIVYQQWDLITGPSTSIANVSAVGLPAINQYGYATGNYFNIFDYDHLVPANHTIRIVGNTSFTINGNSPIQIDTQLNISSNLLLGYNQGGTSSVGITSNADLSLVPSVGSTNPNDNPAKSFSGANLYIATTGTVSVNGIDLTGNLNIYDTGNFTASRDRYTSGTINPKPTALAYDVSAQNIFLNGTLNSTVQANFNGNVTVTSDLNIYSYGSNTSEGSSITFGSFAKDYSDIYRLKVDGNFTANPTSKLTPTTIPFSFNPFPVRTGIYDINIFSDTTTIGKTTAPTSGTATFKNTGRLKIGSPDSIPNPTFTTTKNIDGSKTARSDINAVSSTIIFADITAGTSITLNGALETDVAEDLNNRTFTINAKNGSLTIGGSVVLNTVLNSKNGSDLIMSAGTVVNNNIPDGNQILIGGANGPSRILTIEQCSGFKSTGSIKLKNLNINTKNTNVNSGAGTYLFQGNIGINGSGVTLTTGTGMFNIRFEGAQNYFDGVVTFVNFGKVILGVTSSSTFHFGGNAFFNATQDLFTNIINSPIVCGIGIIEGPGFVTLNGAILAPGGFIDPNNNLVSFGTLTFNTPVNLKESFATLSPDLVLGTYYPEIVNNLSQDKIKTTNLVLDTQYILYPVFRTLDILVGTKFTVVDQTSGLPIFGRFRGLTNPLTNTYSTLNEGETFYASGAKYTITYQGGNGNDVVITYLGLAEGVETIVYVDLNNFLNVYGKDGNSNVTMQNSFNSSNVLQLAISDKTYKLDGFAYGTKAFKDSMVIPIGNPIAVGDSEFQGIQVEQNSGNDQLNLINLSFQDITKLGTNPFIDPSLYVNTTYNTNIKNVSFSFNGGPSSYPSKDTDILNLVGTNRNIETDIIKQSSTVTIQGYDIIRSDNSTAVNDLYTGTLASQGSLFSANQTINAFNIFGNIYADKGILSFGTINRSDVILENAKPIEGSVVLPLVPTTPGNVVFTGSIFLSDGVNVNFGDGNSSTNFQFQNIYGTSGGLTSNIIFNTNLNTLVYNGINKNTDNPQTYLVSNIFGGNINFIGSVGTDIGTITFTNSGNSYFNGTVNSTKISIIKTDGNINFNQQVGLVDEPVTIEITNITNGNSITFNNNLYAKSFSSLGSLAQSNYSIKFLGSITNVIDNVTFNNSGSIVLGDTNDTLYFKGGIQIEATNTEFYNTSVSIFGKISSDGAVIKLGSANPSQNNPIQNVLPITLTGDSSIQSNSILNTTSASPITLGKINSNGFTLTLDSGNISGSLIQVLEISGTNGKLVVNSSGGVNIGKVGNFIDPVNIDNSSFSEIFGSIIINDTIGDVVFSGPVLVNEIITAKKNYNVLFNGTNRVTSSYTTYVNSFPIYRWFYFVTSSSPTVFQNQGNVTFGIHGSDSQSDMDLFIFSGGVSTSTISGSTNLASRLYTVNKNIDLGSTVTTDSSFINTYFSSQVFNDFSGPTFLNPQIAQSIQSVPSGANAQAVGPQFNANEIINANILKAFGFSSNQLTSIGALSPPVEAFPSPYGNLPYPIQTGNISITTITNDAYYLHLNAGGLGIYGSTVGGNVAIGTYVGGASDDQLGFYRGSNFSISNTMVANNLYVGTIANAAASLSNVANYALSGIATGTAPLSFLNSPSLPAQIDLTGSVTIQSNFTIKKNFIVTPDVNNLLILGGNNSLIADNFISNSGVLQLGNSSSSVFNISNNLNVQGPSIKRIGGSLSAVSSKVLDFGPGPISLVADTVLTTSGIGKTSLGQITNNQFNLIINGVSELQRFADNSSLSPYPSLTNPISYIPTNNFVGAGVGGSQNKGNVTFNGVVQVQDDSLFKLNTPQLVTSGFSSATGNGIAAIGYTRLPDVVVSGGGGSGAVVNAVLGIPIAGFTGTVIGNTVTFVPNSVPTLLAPGSYNITLQQAIVPFSPNPLAPLPNPTQFLSPSASGLNSFQPATGNISVSAGFVTSLTLNGISNGFAGSGYTDLTNLYFSNTTVNNTPVGQPVVGGLVRLDLQYPGAGYTSAPTVSVLNTTSGIVSNGNSSGIGFYGTNGAAPLSAINNGVTPNVIINTTISPATIATGNVINIPTTTTLRKQGTGSVFLNSDSSANTSGLVTTIENGNFFFENAKINAATVTNVAGNGLLGGTNGTLGAVNILPRGQLSPGNLTNPIGVLNLQGNLSVQSTYKVDIRSVAFNLFDQVNVTGSVILAKNNINGILDVAFTPDADVISGNTFGIISNDGTDAVTGTTTSTGTTYFKTPAGVVLNQGDSFTVNMPNGTDVATFQISYTGNIAANGTASLTGGNDVVIQITGIQSISSAAAAKSQNPNKLFAVSTDSGGGPIVKISFADGSGFSFFAYDTSFTGGVRTAIGDVNGDGVADLITAAGPGGGPHVIIWTITPGVPYATVQSGFFAFEPGFTGGITLATGNINGDVSASNNSLDDIIVGAGAGGGPRVKAFAGNANFAAINNQSQLVDFFAYAPEFNLGVNVAAGDRTADGNDEIITGAAQGGGPHVQVWQISNGTANSIQSFFAFDPAYLCGVFVGSGDLDGDGLADIYTGTGSGPIGSVGIYFGNGAISRLEPFGSGFTGGVRVGAALGALNSNTNTYPPYLLTAAGPGGGPQVSLFDSNLNIVDAFFAFQENFTGGVLASTTVNT